AITRFKVLDYWGLKKVEVDGSGGSVNRMDHFPDRRPSPDGSSESAEGGVPVRRLLLRRLLELIRGEFEPRTWAAFWGVAAEGRSAKDLGDELGMTVGAVYVAKSRVVKRLREEAEALGFDFPEDNA